MKRGPGRPRVYNSFARRRVATALRKFGLTRGLAFLRSQGLTVSQTLAYDVARENGITFQRGRPKVDKRHLTKQAA